VWNFCLAARARGLAHEVQRREARAEAEAAELLGIPEHVQQGALIPVAYTLGTDFKPGPRRDLDRILHVNGW
jgi:nitroreductase